MSQLVARQPLPDWLGFNQFFSLSTRMRTDLTKIGTCHINVQRAQEYHHLLEYVMPVHAINIAFDPVVAN